MIDPKDQICKTVKTFEKGRLSTSGRAEDSKYLFGLNIEVNILESLSGIVIEIEIFDADFSLQRHEIPLPR